jgi:hypothetical protein
MFETDDAADREAFLDAFAARAEKAFADHELEVELEDAATGWFAYRCRRPESHSASWSMHFRVVFGPNLIAVYGDIGNSMFCPGPSRNGRTFARAVGSLSYLLEKRPTGAVPPDIFLPRAVEAYLRDQLAAAQAAAAAGEADTTPAVESYEAALLEWQDVNGGDPGAPAEAYRIVDWVEGDAFEVVDQFYVPARASLWGFHALRTWARLFEAREAALEAPPEPARLEGPWDDDAALHGALLARLDRLEGPWGGHLVPDWCSPARSPSELLGIALLELAGHQGAVRGLRDEFALGETPTRIFDAVRGRLRRLEALERWNRTDLPDPRPGDLLVAFSRRDVAARRRVDPAAPPHPGVFQALDLSDRTPDDPEAPTGVAWWAWGGEHGYVRPTSPEGWAWIRLCVRGDR